MFQHLYANALLLALRRGHLFTIYNYIIRKVITATKSSRNSRKLIGIGGRIIT